MAKYGRCSPDWYQDVINKLGGDEVARSFLRGELVVPELARSWREEDGVIYFSVKTTSGVTTEIAVLKGVLFTDCNRITKKIRAFAKAFRTPDKRKLKKPSNKVARLIREKFTNKEFKDMRLWAIVVMHEPIKGLDSISVLQSAERSRWLNAHDDRPDYKWNRGFGFAFAISSK